MQPPPVSHVHVPLTKNGSGFAKASSVPVRLSTGSSPVGEPPIVQWKSAPSPWYNGTILSGALDSRRPSMFDCAERVAWNGQSAIHREDSTIAADISPLVLVKGLRAPWMLEDCVIPPERQPPRTFLLTPRKCPSPTSMTPMTPTKCYWNL